MLQNWAWNPVSLVSQVQTFDIEQDCSKYIAYLRDTIAWLTIKSGCVQKTNNYTESEWMGLCVSQSWNLIAEW
jgi:hypothetical protein